MPRLDLKIWQLKITVFLIASAVYLLCAYAMHGNAFFWVALVFPLLALVAPRWSWGLLLYLLALYSVSQLGISLKYWILSDLPVPEKATLIGFAGGLVAYEYIALFVIALLYAWSRREKPKVRKHPSEG